MLFIHIFHSDWINCKDSSCTVLVCKHEQSIAIQMKHSSNLTFQCVIDYWGTHLDAKLLLGIPGAILSFNVVHVHVDIIVL